MKKESENYVDIISVHSTEGKKNKSTINLHQEQSTGQKNESKVMKKKYMVFF